MHEEYRVFACVADAVAHYFYIGYSSVFDYDGKRFMARGSERVVEIEKAGFLQVEATVFTAERGLT